MGLLEAIFDGGVVGAGGAGFPTHKKLVPGTSLLIVNAVECEPLLASDRYVMRHYSDNVISALIRLGQELEIPRVVIGIKRTYLDEIASLRTAIAKTGAVIEIYEVDSFYPAGDEQILIHEITGQTVPPGQIPLALGIVVLNVTTVYTIACALEGQPVTRRLVTVNAEVNHPVIVDAPVGVMPADLISAAGGTNLTDYRIVRGGPMMGRKYQRDAVFGYGKADGGLLVLPPANPVISLNDKPMERVISEARSICIQCSICTELCPRYLVGHQMRPHRVMRAVATQCNPTDLTDALLCCECGVCELFACPMGLSPRQMNILVKRQLREAGVGIADTEVHLDHTSGRPYRRIAQSRFIERLGLGGYPNHLNDYVSIEPDSVRIPTRHGVGKPSTPVVGVGDVVACGQVIAEVAREDVGCLVHASIEGRVTQVSADEICIERRG